MEAGTRGRQPSRLRRGPAGGVALFQIPCLFAAALEIELQLKKVTGNSKAQCTTVPAYAYDSWTRSPFTSPNTHITPHPNTP